MTHLCYRPDGPRVLVDGPEAECETCAARAKEWQTKQQDAVDVVLAKLRTMPRIEPLTPEMSDSERDAAVRRAVGRLAGQEFPARPSIQARTDTWRATGNWPL